MFTARIEPDVFITQVNDIKAKLTCQIVLLTLYHRVIPRSEFQGGRLFPRVLQVGKSKILYVGNSKTTHAGKRNVLQGGKS
jgi:hypothetical protein